MNNKLTFEIDKFQLLENSQNEQLSILKMWIVRAGNNLHNIPISWDSIVSAKESLVGKPVLAYYDEVFDKLGGHEREEVPVGCFLKMDDITQEEDENGDMWLCSKAYLWKKYYPEIIELLKKENGETAVSMEIEVLDGKKNGERFNSVDLFSFMGVTLIGVEPAIPNAKAKVLQFSKMVEDTAKMVEEFSSGYKGIDFKIPNNIKENAKEGRRLYNSLKRGGTPYFLSINKHLVNEEFVSPEKLKKLHSSLEKKALKENTSDENHVSFMLMGGKDSMLWSKSLLKEMEDANRNQLSSFSKKKEKEEEESMKKTIRNDFAVSDEPKKEDETQEEKQEEKMAEEDVPEKEAEKEFEVEAETEKEEDEDSAKEEMAEKPAEADAGENKEEGVDSKEETRMSLDGYADVTATLQMLELETDNARELGSLYVSPEAGKAFSILVSKVKELYAENITLKEYKATEDKKAFSAIVTNTLNSVSDVLPENTLNSFKKDSENFSLDNINIWENKVKAEAFSFSKNKEEVKEDKIIKMSLPFTNLPAVQKKDTVWG